MDPAPTQQLTVDNAADVQPATFANTRTAKPADVGGTVRIASFNVLNYFTTTGADAETLGSTCSYYTDRDGNPITVKTCDPVGVRGAADAANLARQQAKIVAAINALGADVVSLEEIENSTIAGESRDAALATLTAALNADAGSTRWAYVPSPTTLPATEDVIRTAFLYNPATVKPVGESVIDTDPAFDQARYPLAQVFVPRKQAHRPFITIANHFKSKGSCPEASDDPNADAGQGCWNALRVEQAEALASFATGLEASARTDRVFLIGDFNAYTHEDPITALAEAGYTDQGAKTGKYSYSYDGESGSLDHILASPGAEKLVTGADIWNINAGEAIALEYSRYNYTDQTTTPRRTAPATTTRSWSASRPRRNRCRRTPRSRCRSTGFGSAARSPRPRRSGARTRARSGSATTGGRSPPRSSTASPRSSSPAPSGWGTTP